MGKEMLIGLAQRLLRNPIFYMMRIKVRGFVHENE
jgi:hypothetical protein